MTLHICFLVRNLELWRLLRDVAAEEEEQRRECELGESVVGADEEFKVVLGDSVDAGDEVCYLLQVCVCVLSRIKLDVNAEHLDYKYASEVVTQEDLPALARLCV